MKARIVLMICALGLAFGPVSAQAIHRQAVSHRQVKKKENIFKRLVSGAKKHRKKILMAALAAALLAGGGYGFMRMHQPNIDSFAGKKEPAVFNGTVKSKEDILQRYAPEATKVRESFKDLTDERVARLIDTGSHPVIREEAKKERAARKTARQLHEKNLAEQDAAAMKVLAAMDSEDLTRLNSSPNTKPRSRQRIQTELNRRKRQEELEELFAHLSADRSDPPKEVRTYSKELGLRIHPTHEMPRIKPIDQQASLIVDHSQDGEFNSPIPGRPNVSEWASVPNENAQSRLDEVFDFNVAEARREIEGSGKAKIKKLRTEGATLAIREAARQLHEKNIAERRIRSKQERNAQIREFEQQREHFLSGMQTDTLRKILQSKSLKPVQRQRIVHELNKRAKAYALKLQANADRKRVELLEKLATQRNAEGAWKQQEQRLNELAKALLEQGKTSNIERMAQSPKDSPGREIARRALEIAKAEGREIETARRRLTF